MVKKKQSISEVIPEKEEAIPVKEQEVPVEHKCPRCGANMVITGGGPSGSDLHCNKCGLNNTKVI